MPPHLSPLPSSTGYKNTPEKKQTSYLAKHGVQKSEKKTLKPFLEFEKQTFEETGGVQKNMKILWKPASLPEHKET